MAVIPDCVEDGILLERPGGIGADSVQNSTPPPRAVEARLAIAAPSRG